MDIHKEIEEFKVSFNEGGILTRTLLILGFIFTLSSVTSLSGIVVEWKGFILDGLNFYQSYFVQPIISAASILGLGYSKTEIHVATISSICVTVGMRLLAIGQKVAFREINSRYDSELEPSMFFYWAIAIVVPLGIWLWYGISNPTIRPWYVISVSILYPIFIVIPKLIMSKFGYEQFEKNHFNYFKSYYAYMVVIFIIIGALAAINTGLHESNLHNSSKRNAVTGAPS